MQSVPLANKKLPPPPSLLLLLPIGANLMKLSKGTTYRSVAAYGMRCNFPVLRHFFHSTLHHSLPLCCIRMRGLPLQRVDIFFSCKSRIQQLFFNRPSSRIILFSFLFNSRNLKASLRFQDRLKLVQIYHQ